MKILSIHISNIGLIKDERITLDKSLILFYGEIRQGKSTILNSVRWCFGGSFPQDIIRHGAREAFVEMEFDRGSIRREFYVAKDQTTKARAIALILDGHQVKSPVDEISKFLNPFLLDQDFLKNMGELDRKRYFTDLFGVNTDDLDKQLQENDREARELRAKIKGYGDIDLAPVELIDLSKLKAERQKIVDAATKDVLAVDEEIKRRDQEYYQLRTAADEANAKADADAKNRESAGNRIEVISEEIAMLEAKIATLKTERSEIQGNLEATSAIARVELPPRPDYTELRASIKPLDTSEIDERILQAGANNARYEQYAKNVERGKARSEDEQALLGFERRMREIKEEKIARLTTINNTSGIPGLSFNENGDFIYEGTSAGMLSTSQVMKLSSDLSSLYPEGLSIELLDRAESLGKSIFGFIERARAEEKTILATIVGERPANVPEEIGVFVVENGKVTP